MFFRNRPIDELRVELSVTNRLFAQYIHLKRQEIEQMSQLLDALAAQTTSVTALAAAVAAVPAPVDESAVTAQVVSNTAVVDDAVKKLQALAGTPAA